ncbi:MAG: hypothetical protein LBE48_00960 [Methanomassiliicoccaceae archaeon]|nr:hypothetical protein [Methanomassiliicoccaceae archaeon]
MIAFTAVIALAAMVLCMIPAASAADGDGAGTYADIRAETYLTGTGKAVEYKIFATDLKNDKEVAFTAKLVDGNGVSVGSVSPSSQLSVDEKGTTLSVTAPSSPGSYTLTVEFKFKDGDDDILVTKTAPLRVVVPITLSATIDNSAGGTIVNMAVRFVVDGKVIEESEQDITVNAKETKAVTYDWVTEALPNGTHTMYLEGDVGPMGDSVPGLNDKKEFFVGQESYTLVEAIVVILFVVLIIIAIWVLRKPVKNVGKPKGRR